MGMLSRLWGRRGVDEVRGHQQLAEMVERVIKLSPRLRLVPRCQPRLETSVKKALDHLYGVVASLPAAREASPSAWASDPCIHAFFATPADVPVPFSRSEHLRALFEREPGLQQAYAVLGMAACERHTLGVALEGGITRHDVQQRTVSFRDHQVRICAADQTGLGDEIVRHMVDQLTLEGLARMVTDKSRRNVLEEERSLLLARLRLLERQGTGMRAVIGSDAQADSGDTARLRDQLDENDMELNRLRSPIEALDRQLDAVCEVFSDPGPRLKVWHRRLYLSRMNVMLGENATDAGEVVDMEVARVPGDPPQERTFALVCFSRAHLEAPKDMLAEAARLLL